MTKKQKKPKSMRMKQSRKAATKARPISPIRPLKQPTLAGLPRVRNAKLDKYAEAVGECRDSINEATREIKGYKAAALKEMLAKKVAFWSHGGVDFIVMPGEPVLKVKTHKEGSSETGGGDEDEPEGEAMDAEDAPEGIADESEAPF